MRYGKFCPETGDQHQGPERCVRCGERPPTQKLAYAIWIPDETLSTGGKFASINVEKRPNRIWTLLRGDQPTLPMWPIHGVNAFLEDEMHDWSWYEGVLRYYTRVMNESVWILLEYAE